MKRRRPALGFLPICVMVVLTHCTHPDTPPPIAPPHSVGDGRYLMGTILDVTLVGDDPEALRAALEWSFDQVASIEAVASRHRSDSELSRLNADAGRAPRAGYSSHLHALLSRSREAGYATRGAFDVTVGPLIALWWSAADRQSWPSPDEVATARALVGFDGIVIEDDSELGLRRRGSAIDLGGIAKGYALDIVREGLRRRGIERGLLDFGGSSVWAIGEAPGGGPWRLEVDARSPAESGRVLELVDRAVSVSSSLGDTSDIGARRVGHVIDPRTGLTVDAPRTAVAVGPSATDAEVWSTALLVLDAREGEALAQRARLETWVQFEDGKTIESSGFARYWAPAPASSRAGEAH